MNKVSSLYSTLGSSIYNQVMKVIKSNKDSISRYPSVNNLIGIKVNQAQSLNDIIALSDFLNISGTYFNFRPTNIIASEGSYYMDLLFKGSEEDALNKFRQWENKKISDNISFTSRIEARKVLLNLNKVIKPDGVDSEDQKDETDFDKL